MTSRTRVVGANNTCNIFFNFNLILPNTQNIGNMTSRSRVI